MPVRRTVVLAGAFVLLLIAYLATDPRPEEEAPVAELGALLECAPADVEELAFRFSGGELRASRRDDGWAVPLEGDRARWVEVGLDGVVDGLCRLPVLDRIDTRETGETFGLDDPIAEIEIRIANRVHSLLAGGTSPTEAVVYVRIDDGPFVLSVGSVFQAELRKVERQVVGNPIAVQRDISYVENLGGEP